MFSTVFNAAGVNLRAASRSSFTFFGLPSLLPDWPLTNLPPPSRTTGRFVGSLSSSIVFSVKIDPAPAVASARLPFKLVHDRPPHKGGDRTHLMLCSRPDTGLQFNGHPYLLNAAGVILYGHGHCIPFQKRRARMGGPWVAI